MRFNNYIWELYKVSAKGQELIKLWEPRESFPSEKFAVTAEKPEDINVLINSGLAKYIVGPKANYRQLWHDYFRSKYDFTNADIRKLYEEWIENGVSIGDFIIFPKNEPEFWLNYLESLSKRFYHLYPDYFFPYRFECRFNEMQEIFFEFNIPLPEMPPKRDLHERALYYLDLCDALSEFRKSNGFTPAEFCAFIYGFAPNVLNELEDKEMPNPSKVWFVGGHKGNFELLDNSDNNSSIRWQGNIDTRRGDIIVMYCLTPRSYIHSIWRAGCDGFADPFFYWYSTVEIVNPIKLDSHIAQKDLEINSVWSNNPLVRKNLQGINGYPIKYSEYLELLSLLKSKGQNTANLPRITPTSKFDTQNLLDERDVEIKLIEPFLKALGYRPEEWIRQMPVKMGRGERNYPDYCFDSNSKRGDESARMILESKYEVKTQKELQEAYFQAKSYALRLQSEIFLIASKEGIWIFQKEVGGFKFNNYLHFNWIDIENPDILHQISQVMCRK